MADFWQTRLPQLGQHHRRADAAATTFYFAKSRQDLDLGGHACRSRPVYDWFSFQNSKPIICACAILFDIIK